MGELLSQAGIFSGELVVPETSSVSAADVMLGAATRFAERFGSGEPITAAAIKEVSAGPLTEHIPASCMWDLSTQGAEGELRAFTWWGEDKKK